MSQKTLLIAVCGMLAAGGILGAGAQEEEEDKVRLATFQETAQIVVDTIVSNNVTASITLQSTSNQEIKVPSELEGSILDNDRVTGIVVTNEDSCVLGVSGESCILINVQRSEEWEGIIETQDETKKIGDSLIGRINGFFDTGAEYHSTFLHYKDDVDVAFGTTGTVLGKNTVSAVYTMPMEATDSMYGKISSLLLAQAIRESGGFYDVAKKMASEDDAKTTFTMIRQGSGMLYQLRLSVDHAGADKIDAELRPLEFLKADRLYRSDYFSQGFYPFNSLIQVVVLGSQEIVKTDPDFIDTELRNGVMIPADPRQSGWINQGAGEVKELVFLFGEETSVDRDEVKITLPSSQGGEQTGDGKAAEEETESYESIIILAVISAGAVGAAVFFLKGYKKSPLSS